MIIQFGKYRITQWILFVSIIIFTITTNVQINRLLCVLIAFSTGLDYLLKRKFTINLNSHIIWYTVYCILLCVSIVYAITPQVKVYSVIISCFTTLILGCCLHYNIVSKDDVLFYLKAFMVASVALIVNMISVYGINTFKYIQQSEVSIRIGDDVSNANSVGISMAYGAIIALFFLMQNSNKYTTALYKIIHIAIILLSSVFVMLSGSRKALVILFFGFSVIFVFCGKRGSVIKRIGSIIIAGIAVLILFLAVRNVPAFSLIYNRMDSLLSGLSGTGTLDFSSRERFRFIEEGWDAFLRHPILGEGAYSSYMYFHTYSHNNFIEVLMNTGFIGFMIFYIPYIKNCLEFFKTSRHDNTYWILVVLYFWVLLGGYGMVTYYNKLEFFIVIIANQWLILNRKELYNNSSNLLSPNSSRFKI